jgi:hypothetical protein
MKIHKNISLTAFNIISFTLSTIVMGYVWLLMGYIWLVMVNSTEYNIYTGCPKDTPICVDDEKLKFYIGNMSSCIYIAKINAVCCVIMMLAMLFFEQIMVRIYKV